MLYAQVIMGFLKFGRKNTLQNAAIRQNNLDAYGTYLARGNGVNSSDTAFIIFGIILIGFVMYLIVKK